MDYYFMIDSDIELPYTFTEEHGIPVFYMPYTIDGQEYMFDLGKTTDFEGFYKRLRAGAEALTSTRSVSDIQEFFEALLANGKDILYLSFSSQLSSHSDLAHMAREQALADYPDRRIEIVDSLGISMGAGVLAYDAVLKKEAGMGMDELKKWLEDNRLRAQCYFTVDSLQHLRRTGRLGAVSTTLGTIIDLKPVLTVSREGKVVVFDKVKGKRKVVKYLCDLIEKYISDDEFDKELLVINNADNYETADAIREYAVEHFGFKNVWFMNVGPVISIHAGPGVVGVMFMGKEKEM